MIILQVVVVVRQNEQNMKWDTIEDYIPHRETFRGLGHVGPTIPISNPLDIFKYFFDDALMDIIVNNTN